MVNLSKGPAEPRSLAAIAFLKARFDIGADLLDMFMPLLADAFSSLAGQSFTAIDVQAQLRARHGLEMPQHTVSTLLVRAKKQGLVARDSGRYTTTMIADPGVDDILTAKKRIEAAQLALGHDFQMHASKRGLTLASDASSLALILEFLERQQVGLLLDGSASALSSISASNREMTIVAEFARDAIEAGGPDKSTISDILEGLVLYRAAFLPDIAEARRKFTGLRIFLDSGIVRQILGYEGVSMQQLMRETVTVLKAADIQCLVFDKTIVEIRRILSMYERKLATAEGRRSLHPVPMARFLLTSRKTPADIAEMDALLEQSISAEGLQIAPMPAHVPQYTLDEKNLAERLADRQTGDDESPRVRHDVDCIAGVLTLRRGHRANKLEMARVLFVSSSTLVIKNTRRWFRDQGETGIEPIVNIRALANLAWLKQPSLSAEFKLHELVALCSAALRPPREIWVRFQRHLDKLRTSNSITSEEAAAIVVSELADRLLGEIAMSDEEQDGADAHTLDEVIEKVKATYTADAAAKIAQAEAARDAAIEDTKRQASEEISKALVERNRALAMAKEREVMSLVEVDKANARLERLRERGHLRAKRAADAAAWSSYVLLAGLSLLGAGWLLLGHGWHGVVAGLSVVVFVLMEILGVLGHLRHVRVRLQATLLAAIKRRTDW